MATIQLINNEVKLEPHILDEIEKREEIFKKHSTLISEIEFCKSFFLDREKSHPQEDLSKHFLIFSYNYFDIGLLDEAREMLAHVKEEYFYSGILKDMLIAVESRNMADNLERRRKFDEARPLRDTAEFFLVVVGIIPHLLKEEQIKDTPHFKIFIEQLNRQQFKIEFAPQIGLVSE